MPISVLTSVAEELSSLSMSSYQLIPSLVAITDKSTVSALRDFIFTSNLGHRC